MEVKSKWDQNFEKNLKLIFVEINFWENFFNWTSTSM